MMNVMSCGVWKCCFENEDAIYGAIGNKTGWQIVAIERTSYIVNQLS